MLQHVFSEQSPVRKISVDVNGSCKKLINQSEILSEGQCVGSTRDGEAPFLKRLAHGLEHTPFELGRFKKDTKYRDARVKFRRPWD